MSIKGYLFLRKGDLVEVNDVMCCAEFMYSMKNKTYRLTEHSLITNHRFESIVDKMGTEYTPMYICRKGIKRKIPKEEIALTKLKQ